MRASLAGEFHVARPPAPISSDGYHVSVDELRSVQRHAVPAAEEAPSANQRDTAAVVLMHDSLDAAHAQAGRVLHLTAEEIRVENVHLRSLERPP
jgi:hypothetical protein